MYIYDVFVSYKRMDAEWDTWIRDVFVKTLCGLVRNDVGEVSVFIDRDIELGSSWPNKLINAHANSRLLIALWNYEYFASDWCRNEFKLMIYREKELGFRTDDNPRGLILPFRLCKNLSGFPPEIGDIQYDMIDKYANPYINPKSPFNDEFYSYLQENCRHKVAQAITDAREMPESQCNPGWKNFNYGLVSKFKAENNQEFSMKLENLNKTPRPSPDLSEFDGDNDL